MPFCPKCGAEFGGGKSSCPICGKAGEKYPLYARVFRAKRTVYPVLRQEADGL